MHQIPRIKVSYVHIWTMNCVTKKLLGVMDYFIKALLLFFTFVLNHIAIWMSVANGLAIQRLLNLICQRSFFSNLREGIFFLKNTLFYTFHHKQRLSLIIRKALLFLGLSYICILGLNLLTNQIDNAGMLFAPRRQD